MLPGDGREVLPLQEEQWLERLPLEGATVSANILFLLQHNRRSFRRRLQT